MTTEEPQIDVFDAHAKAVGSKAAGYAWLARISKVHLELRVYNTLINRLAQGVSVSYEKEVQLIETRKTRDRLAGQGADATTLKEFDEDLKTCKAELDILSRIQALAFDARKCLGEGADKVLEHLRIRDLSPRHAFKTSTSKLEKKSEKQDVNYLIRALDTEGDRQERLLVRETKDKDNRTLLTEIVARFIYSETKDNDGVVHGDIDHYIEDVGRDDVVVTEACTEIEDRFEHEITGASGTRFRTAIGHLTAALQGIPLYPRGFVYYCAASKAPVVSLTRELVRWVDFKFREGSDGCQFLALPLLGGIEVEETVISAANLHLQTKLAIAIARIQTLREEIQQADDLEDGIEREAKLKELKAEEISIREDVARVQDSVKTCLAEMQTAEGVIHQASKVLVVEYRRLLGV